MAFVTCNFLRLAVFLGPPSITCVSACHSERVGRSGHPARTTTGQEKIDIDASYEPTNNTWGTFWQESRGARFSLRIHAVSPVEKATSVGWDGLKVDHKKRHVVRCKSGCTIIIPRCVEYIPAHCGTLVFFHRPAGERKDSKNMPATEKNVAQTEGWSKQQQQCNGRHVYARPSPMPAHCLCAKGRRRRMTGFVCSAGRGRRCPRLIIYTFEQLANTTAVWQCIHALLLVGLTDATAVHQPPCKQRMHSPAWQNAKQEPQWN